MEILLKLVPGNSSLNDSLFISLLSSATFRRPEGTVHKVFCAQSVGDFGDRLIIYVKVTSRPRSLQMITDAQCP